MQDVLVKETAPTNGVRAAEGRAAGETAAAEDRSAETRSARVAEMMARYLGETIVAGFATDDVTEIYVNP